MTSNGARPILSFCMAGRDDDYTPDFRYRLETTIEYLAASIRESGHSGKVEAVITDWGGEQALRDVVRLTPDACAIARFVRVPRETILGLQQGNDYFSTAQSTNVAIRRAAGTYRALCGTDILIPSHTVDALVNALESGADIHGMHPDSALMFCTRKKIPWDVVANQPSVAGWRRFLHANAWMLDKDDCLAPGFLGGNASVIMMHAALWDEFGGVCESMTGWGWSDVELTLRVTGYYPWLDMTGLGAEVFDLAHQSGGDKRSEALRTPNRYEVNAGPGVNGPSWGLANLDLDVSNAVPRAALQRVPRKIDAAGALNRAGCHVSEKLTAMLQDGTWLFDLFTDDEEIFLAVACVMAAEMNEPAVIVDIGASKACAAAATLSLHRWAEYLGVDWWLGSCVGIGHPTRLGYMLHSKFVGFTGRGSFVPNPESLPIFLERSGFQAVDLAVFREAVFGVEAIAAAAFRKLCSMLSPDGLIVVRRQNGRRRPLETGAADIVVRDVAGMDVSLVFRRESLVGQAIDEQTASIRALSSTVLGRLPEHPARTRFPEPFLGRIVGAPPDMTLAVGGYGIYGRALMDVLKSHNADRFRSENIVIWDNFKDKRELTSLGFRCYSPDEHDEWPANYLFAITPLDNETMVAQLMALLTRYLTREGKTRLVVGGLDANASRALAILRDQPDIVAGRIELLAWSEEGGQENAGSRGWTPECGPFPSADTLVLLPSISSGGMRERLERLGAQRGESFVDNLLWC
jgi:hypothetical protein